MGINVAAVATAVADQGGAWWWVAHRCDPVVGVCAPFGIHIAGHSAHPPTRKRERRSKTNMFSKLRKVSQPLRQLADL